MTWTKTGLNPTDGLDPCVVELGGRRLLLGAYQDRVWAIEDRCSHAHCAFTSDGEVDGDVVICDCHGSEFDVFTGAVRRPPASQPITVFPVRMHLGQIEVDL